MDMEMFNDHISQGISLMSAENYEAAKTEFEAAIQLDKKSYEAYIHLGNAFANLGRHDEAIDAFKNALIVSPDSGEALYSIGNIHLLKDEKLKAVEYYNKAEAVGFQRAELYQMLAMIFFEAGDSPQAIRNITRAISLEPFDGNLRLFKARIFLADNKFDEAIETLEEMQKILPDAFEAYDLQSQIYCGQGQYETALKICEEGVSRFPDDANLALSKLKVLVEMNDDVSAKDFIVSMKNTGLYNRVLKEATIQESIVLLRAMEIDKTLDILKSANQQLNGDVDLLYLILDVYGKSEDYNNVLEYSTKLLELNPDMYYEATAKYFHAHALDKLGREEAQSEYKKLTSEFRRLTISTPSFYEGYIYRLMCHTRIGEYDKALELADYLENLHPESADSHAFRYFIYKDKGDEENAEKEKRAAMNINPQIVL